MLEYPFSMLQKDFISLRKYINGSDEISLETLIRRLNVKFDSLNKEIPKILYDGIIRNEVSETKISNLSELFVFGIPETISQQFISINQEKRLFVKENFFLNWQNIITDMSPVFLISSFIFSLETFISAYESLKNGALNGIKEFFYNYILSNCKHTALLSPNILPLDELCKENNGLYDLHIHLNGISEMDAVWQNLLYDKDNNLINIVNNIDSDNFQYQLEQMGFAYSNYESFLSKLIDRAQEIRGCFFDIIIGEQITEKKEFNNLKINPFFFFIQ